MEKEVIFENFSKNKPVQFNMEITTGCPLFCPKCYCTLDGKKDIPVDIAKKRLSEAVALGIMNVSLSGGETLLHPGIYDIISHANSLGMNTALATSGLNFDSNTIVRLQEAGLTQLYISLNGSTNEINSFSRNGYEYAIKALSLLRYSSFSEYYINWVAQENNIDDFCNLIELAKAFNVKKILVLGLRPDSKNGINDYPSFDKTKKLANIIMKNNAEDDIIVDVEYCYTELKNLLAIMENTDDYAFCAAGTRYFSVTVDGDFAPCRHINLAERHDSLDSFFMNSEAMNKVRNAKRDKAMKCLLCQYGKRCSTCLAYSHKLEGVIKSNNVLCKLPKNMV